MEWKLLGDAALEPWDRPESDRPVGSMAEIQYERQVLRIYSMDYSVCISMGELLSRGYGSCRIRSIMGTLLP